MHLNEKTIESEQKFDGKIVKLFVDKAEVENGDTVTREVIKHPGGVCVVALDEEDNVLFVRQFRYPHQKVLPEIPAGKLEFGEDHRARRAAPATSSTIWAALSPPPLMTRR